MDHPTFCAQGRKELYCPAVLLYTCSKSILTTEQVYKTLSSKQTQAHILSNNGCDLKFCAHIPTSKMLPTAGPGVNKSVRSTLIQSTRAGPHPI